jgi:NADPH:quinone reductase-like Zn-dependent oxidoreductase
MRTIGRAIRFFAKKPSGKRPQVLAASVIFAICSAAMETPVSPVLICPSPTSARQAVTPAGAAVIATSSSDEKLERVRALGADHVINYRQIPDWGKRVRALTGGGVDHVVEVGGPGTLAQSIAAVRVGGHISLIGVLTGLQGEMPTVDLMAKQARLQGLMVGSRRQQQDHVAALEQSGVRPVLDRSFPLDHLADAFRYQASGVHFGKVAVEW